MSFGQGQIDFTTMLFIRRAFIAVFGLLLLQFMLLGSGTVCALHHGAARARDQSHAMHMGESLQRTSAPHTTVLAAVTLDDGPMTPMDGAGDHESCRMPLLPGPCASMSACSISATPSRAVGTSIGSRVVAFALPSPDQGHSGPTFAPEIPPPRA